MTAIRVKPWETQEGDVILGTGLTITGRYSYSQGDIGSDKERQFYTLPLRTKDGIETDITYNGETNLTVLRAEQ